MSGFWAVGGRAEHDRARRVMGASAESLTSAETEASVEGRQQSAPWLGQVHQQLHVMLASLFIRSGVSSSALRRVQLAIVITAVFAAATALLFQSSICLLAIPAAFALSWWWLQQRSFNRSEAFERDYPALLLAIASSVRTGLDPLTALVRARELFPNDSAIGKELRAFSEAIESGKSEDEALSVFGASIAHPDVRLFRTAFVLARREGSSLAACLQRLTRVTRNRQSFRRKMRAAVAMQKLSSIGIAGCAVVIVAIQAMMNVEAFREAWAHPVGSRMLMAALAIMAVGLVGMLRMSRARI